MSDCEIDVEEGLGSSGVAKELGADKRGLSKDQSVEGVGSGIAAKKLGVDKRGPADQKKDGAKVLQLREFESTVSTRNIQHTEKESGKKDKSALESRDEEEMTSLRRKRLDYFTTLQATPKSRPPPTVSPSPPHRQSSLPSPDSSRLFVEAPMVDSIDLTQVSPVRDDENFGPDYMSDYDNDDCIMHMSDFDLAPAIPSPRHPVASVSFTSPATPASDPPSSTADKSQPTLDSPILCSQTRKHRTSHKSRASHMARLQASPSSSSVRAGACIPKVSTDDDDISYLDPPTFTQDEPELPLPTSTKPKVSVKRVTTVNNNAGFRVGFHVNNFEYIQFCILEIKSIFKLYNIYE